MKPYLLFIAVIIALLLLSCRENYSPRPRGFFRIDFPEKEYRAYTADCPFTFEYPVYGKITPTSLMDPEPCWFDIYFAHYKGRIHMSYLPVDGNLENLIQDAHSLAYKHSVKADAIEEKLWTDTERKVYGVLYDLKGSTASSVQFFLTDSIHHYIRGSLYFKTKIRADSLAPVIDFFRTDILHLIETFEWLPEEK